MRKLTFVAALAFTAALAACGSDDDNGGGGGGGFTQPANTVVVNFTVDDSINKDWKAGELEWKGQMQFDETTRLGHFNNDWLAGPDSTPPEPGWAKLYDDGPWDKKNSTTGQPGHEPKGSTAGDHKWGVTVFVEKPAADQSFGYGLRDATNPDRANGGWVWIGDAGSFTITPTDTVVNAPGMQFPAHGTVDLKLVIDTTNATVAGGGYDLSTIQVKGSPWGWNTVNCFDDGTHGDDVANDDKFTTTLGSSIDRTKPPYPGLLKSGDQPEFVFVLGGAEYKIGTDAPTDGVSAQVKPGDAAWADVAVIQVTGGLGGKNTAVLVP